MRNLLLPVLLFLALPTTAQPITVGPSGAFPTLSAAANANAINAGDTVIVLDGIYSNGTQFLENLHGTAQNPIIIKSETLHGAVFQGGTEAIHLIDCSHLALDGFLIRGQTGNGINIDDGGDYDSPAHHITVRNCRFEDIDASGNNDFLKLSGLDSFLIQNCSFANGAAGSGVDMVGCHWGTIEDCYFEDAGSSGIQAKGGSQYVLIRRNVFRDIDQRAINIGGSTGLEFFRPPLPNPIVGAFEAADIDVFSNVFIGSWAPIAYVGCVRARVRHNTFFKPENWVLRILQETTVSGFLPCSDNEFSNNLVYLSGDLTEVNIGPNTDPQSFTFSHNGWFNETGGAWSPALPVADLAQLIADPLFVNAAQEDFHLLPESPFIGAGQSFPAPATDFDNQLFLNPPSIGAFEGGEPSAVFPAPASLKVKIFPNPAAHELIVEAGVSNATIRLLDSRGGVMAAFYGVNSPAELLCPILAPGLYYLWVEEGPTTVGLPVFLIGGGEIEIMIR